MARLATAAALSAMALSSGEATAAAAAASNAVVTPVVGGEFVLSTPAPYNCDVEFETWETAWTQPWKDYCCEHKQRGCPTSTTTTETTSTGTTTTQTETTTTTSQTETHTTTTLKGCDKLCWYKGVTASCRQRIQWAATHKEHGTASEVAPCPAAQVLVISQCEECGDCALEDAQCEAPPNHDRPAHASFRFRQKFAELPGGGIAAAHASTSLQRAAAGVASIFFVTAVMMIAVRRGFNNRFGQQQQEHLLLVTDNQQRQQRGEAPALD